MAYTLAVCKLLDGYLRGNRTPLYRCSTAWHTRPMNAAPRVRSARFSSNGIVIWSCHEHLDVNQPVHTPSVSGRDHQPWRVALLPLCATKCHDVMGGKPRGLCRQATSPWAVAPGGCTPGVKELALKGIGAARGKPPRSQAWLRKHRVSQRSAERPTGNTAPVSRPGLMGQRLHPTG